MDRGYSGVVNRKEDEILYLSEGFRCLGNIFILANIIVIIYNAQHISDKEYALFIVKVHGRIVGIKRMQTVFSVLLDVTAEFGQGKTYSYELTDSYGDGWSGNAIKVYDITNEPQTLVAELTIDSGAFASGTLDLLDSRIYSFVWAQGYFSYECSFDIKDEVGSIVYSCSDGSVLTDGQVFF